MQIYKNILVGVDLAHCKPLDISGLTPVALEPIHWGIKLAKANAARLLFFSASNITAEALAPLDEEDRYLVHDALLQAGGKVLESLVQKAHGQGVEANSKLVPGRGWHEIIRQVQAGAHDLVVVGTRDLTGLRRMLFGNTAMKLLRRCPCPVLVAKIGTDYAPHHILVATDLNEVSAEAMRLGIAMAHQTKARLHILHVVGYELDDICSTGLPDAKQGDYRRKVRAKAEQVLQAQLAETDARSLGSRLEVSIAGGVGRPDVAIQHFIQLHNIDLLVMGTIGRGGIRGITIGNTAERLLPEVHCSVLAVKPPDFVCPIEAES